MDCFNLYSICSLQRGSNVLQRKLYFSKDPEGVQNFPGGPTFTRGGGGVQMLISIETHITCDFPGGGSPIPLWVRTLSRLGFVYIV